MNKSFKIGDMILVKVDERGYLVYNDSFAASIGTEKIVPIIGRSVFVTNEQPLVEDLDPSAMFITEEYAEKAQIDQKYIGKRACRIYDEAWLPALSAIIVQKFGMTCRNSWCSLINPDAIPNQPDGTYICYNCR